MDGQSEAERRNLRETATAIFLAAIKAVDPKECVKRRLKLSGNDLQIGKEIYSLQTIRKLYLIGIGKAAAAMAHAVETLCTTGGEARRSGRPVASPACLLAGG